MHNQKKAVSIRYNEEHVAPEISDKAAGLDAEELRRPESTSIRILFC